MGNYNNSNGTIAPSFKIGTRGLLLRSGEIVTGLDDVKEYRRLSVTDTRSKQSHDVAYYDLDIPNYYINSWKENVEDGTTTLYIYDKQNRNLVKEVVIHSTFDSSGVKTVFKDENNQSTKVGSIVTYADRAGQEIQDSGYSISDTMLGLSDDAAKTVVPTAKAVSDFIGVVSLPLEERVAGKYSGEIDKD